MVPEPLVPFISSHRYAIRWTKTRHYAVQLLISTQLNKGGPKTMNRSNRQRFIRVMGNDDGSPFARIDTFGSTSAQLLRDYYDRRVPDVI